MKLKTALLFVLAVGVTASLVVAVDAPKKRKAADQKGDPKPKRSNPAGPAINENKATPVERIKAAKDFKVELLYSVPSDKQGSWVNLCVDGKNRIIASDQYGGLYRFAPPAAGQTLDPEKIEKIPAEIRAANGLLWFRNALY